MTADVAGTITTAVHGAASAKNALAVAAALNCIEPEALAAFFHASLATDVEAEPVATGLPASPGAVTGRIVLTAEAAIATGGTGAAVILVRRETTPDDVLGMQASRGILTTRGGMVSHAAVVARGWGIPAVVGAGEVHVDGDTITVGAVVLHEGDEITIDGSTGHIYPGALATTGASAPPELTTLLAWADTVASGHVQVRANADTQDDATIGRRLGAQGIGLCRTEHMFLAADRLAAMRRFILSDDPVGEASALAELEAAQTTDFERVLEAMDTLPVTIRLLDPPLHEFLPDLLDLTAREARGELTDAERVEIVAVRRLHESNPMIGTRGVRLGIVRGGVYEMQVRALCTAAVNLFERGKRPHVEVMIPLVVDAEELRVARGWVTGVLDRIGHPELASDVITVGAMIETPRAALTAGQLAAHADFFSFGTNDLTQMTYAFSRDDVESRLLPAYRAQGILPTNPFAVLDEDGVGELMRIATAAARAAKPGIKLGACGEHAGHPGSAEFLVRLGVDSVSCSPFRVPLARLGVAQALLACGRVHINDVHFDFDFAEPEPEPEVGAEHEAQPVSAASDARPTPPVGRSAADPPHEIDEALVLHTLRVRGFVTPDGFIQSLGQHPHDLLAQLVGNGQVRHIEKRNMYGLLPAGKQLHAELLDNVADDVVQAGLAADYPTFLALNDDFKQLCTQWQVRNGEPNDHSDADYDRDCTERLAGLALAARPVIDGFANALARMARYNERLACAAERVGRGERKQFTGVMCESFHDIWMELHEDLIVLQRIDRAAEGSF
jgi:phosphoenolpyruvate-protein kinase (PTS system EI component)